MMDVYERQLEVILQPHDNDTGHARETSPLFHRQGVDIGIAATAASPAAPCTSLHLLASCHRRHRHSSNQPVSEIGTCLATLTVITLLFTQALIRTSSLFSFWIFLHLNHGKNNVTVEYPWRECMISDFFSTRVDALV